MEYTKQKMLRESALPDRNLKKTIHVQLELKKHIKELQALTQKQYRQRQKEKKDEVNKSKDQEKNGNSPCLCNPDIPQDEKKGNITPSINRKRELTCHGKGHRQYKRRTEKENAQEV